MAYFLMISLRKHWLALWECKHYLRAIQTSRALGLSAQRYDWSTPQWVRRSLRRSAYWALCRVTQESPIFFVVGGVCAIPAVMILISRLVLRTASWMGVSVAGAGL